MKGKPWTPAKAILIIFAAILSCMAFLVILDNGITNGLFKNWVYTSFIVEVHNAYEGVPGGDIMQKVPNWAAIRTFVYVAFTVGTVILMLLLWLVPYFYAKRKTNEVIRDISAAMRMYLAEGKANLPREYMEIENQLMQMRATQQKHEQIIKEETQQKNDLITYLAHDLKTPLASVIGYLSILDEAPDMPLEQKAKYVGIALDKAYRLEQLIDEFFEITRFNLHSIILNKGKINLAFMLQQMADEFYPLLAPQGKRAFVDAPGDFVLWGDADKLSRVFNNILKNAIAYSYEASTIHISVFQQEENAIIRFINQGDPIPPQKLETIFEQFFRLDASRATHTGGAGLGLAIAKEIVTAHGGTLIAESSKESTVFTVTLPISDTKIR